MTDLLDVVAFFLAFGVVVWLLFTWIDGIDE
jgi:hypothetical protein